MEPDRKQFEKEMVEQAAHRMPLTDYAGWQLARVAHRVSIHEGSLLVLWCLRADHQPELLDVFRAEQIDADWTCGIEVLMVARNGSATWVSHDPMRLAGENVFVWIPFAPDIRYERHPKKDGYVLRASLAMRINSHPDSAVPGDCYLMPVGEFRGRFPQFATTRF